MHAGLFEMRGILFWLPAAAKKMAGCVFEALGWSHTFRRTSTQAKKPETPLSLFSLSCILLPVVCTTVHLARLLSVTRVRFIFTPSHPSRCPRFMHSPAALSTGYRRYQPKTRRLPGTRAMSALPP